MGRILTRMCEEAGDVEIIAGFDINTAKLSSYPVFSDPSEFSGKADAVVDFSNPASLDMLLEFCVRENIPVVICTTGHTREQSAGIDAAARKIPVFRSANMSVGINLLTKLVREAAAILGDGFDIEITERHHRTKLDAPSGTALMLADAAEKGRGEPSELIYERQSARKARGKNEIGVLSVRGGTIVGEHNVIFAGADEVIEFKHTAFSREIFANGALAAARFLPRVGRPGVYSMEDAIASQFPKG